MRFRRARFAAIASRSHFRRARSRQTFAGRGPRSFPASARPERSRIDSLRRRASPRPAPSCPSRNSALKNYLFAGHRRPLFPYTLALLAFNHQLAKRVDRRIGRQKAVEHRSEKKCPTALVVIFIKPERDFSAAAEATPRLGTDVPHNFAAGHFTDPLDQLLVNMA